VDSIPIFLVNAEVCNKDNPSRSSAAAVAAATWHNNAARIMMRRKNESPE
jgi:hypothetical protein